MRVAIIAAAALALSACSTMGGGASGFTQAAAEIAKDPNCGHTDRINIILGVVSSGSIFLERNCPMPAAKPPADGSTPKQ